MSTRGFLVSMTVIAVISDSLLHPFYPQYFAEVFGVADPRHVGLYIAACAATVMLSFPAWAALARRAQVLHLLIGTQVATGALALVAHATRSLFAFWAVSLAMMVFKASYLLIYPYALSLERKERHAGTIGLLAFVAHSGNVLSALLAGALFQFVDPRSLFLAMACGDAVQTLICLAVLVAPARARAPEPSPDTAEGTAGPPPGFVLKLGAVMLVLYFSAYLTEPFFARYWEQIGARGGEVVAGAVFAIPGIAALLGLFVDARRGERGSAFAGVVPALALAVAGLWAQASGRAEPVLLGRFLYGWALFQCMVRLDLLLFRVSRAERYAVDFGKVHLFQSTGVLLASFAAGGVVSAWGAVATFLLAASGFALGALAYCGLFRSELWPGRVVT